jgi:hypothetical protein
MTWLAIGTAALAVLAALLWGARRGGKDAVRSEAAEKTLEQIREATAPASDADIERVRQRYRRD